MASEEPAGPLNPDVLYAMAPFLPLRVTAHLNRELRVFRLRQTVRAKIALGGGPGALRLRLDVFDDRGAPLGGWPLLAERAGTGLALTPAPSAGDPDDAAGANRLKLHAARRQRRPRPDPPTHVHWIDALSPADAEEPGPLEAMLQAPPIEDEDVPGGLAPPGADGAPAAAVSPLAAFEGDGAEAVAAIIPILDTRSDLWERGVRLELAIEEHDGARWAPAGAVALDWNAFKDGLAAEAASDGGEGRLAFAFDELPARPGVAPGMNASQQESAAYFLTLLGFLETIKREGYRLRARTLHLAEDMLLEAVRAGWERQAPGVPRTLEARVASSGGRIEAIDWGMNPEEGNEVDLTGLVI
ncbi:hypothetical protein DFJ74DRAFT_709090 [Hyaloraphidium curvatum]|nr:hypothetical protein DFJ74DRAFT_709090 [Hyaloraphidium curvatum]